MVTFGGAYAVLAYVAQQAVEHYRLAAAGEMLDGLGMAETTPGPLIMVLQFVGFMAAYRDPGTLSPMLAARSAACWRPGSRSSPCFLWIFLGAPFIETLRGNKGLRGAVGDHRGRGRRDPQSDLSSQGTQTRDQVPVGVAADQIVPSPAIWCLQRGSKRRLPGQFLSVFGGTIMRSGCQIVAYLLGGIALALLFWKPRGGDRASPAFSRRCGCGRRSPITRCSSPASTRRHISSLLVRHPGQLPLLRRLLARPNISRGIGPLAWLGLAFTAYAAIRIQLIGVHDRASLSGHAHVRCHTLPRDDLYLRNVARRYPYRVGW